MRNNIAVRESLRKFKDNISQTSQPRRSVSSGYVSAVQEDAAGRVVTASVRTNGGGTVRAQVPFGQNVYTGMVVQIENYGSPSLASWAVSGSASLPPGTSGGIIYNQNGSNVLMFDNIWVTDDGYIRAGGTLDENDEPTGSRAQMDEFGFSAWDQYDRAMFRVFARDVEPYLTGDAYLGYLDGGRIEMSAQNLRFGIYNADEVVMQFDPLTGNRITQNLWVGDEAGPQVGIGKWTVDGEDVSIIVARNAGTGTVSDIGNEPVFMVTAAPSRTTLHLGDPDHSTNYVFYDSSANSGEGELTVDAILRAREIEIFGAGLIAEGGYIGAVAGGTSQAGIWLRPKYLEGIGNGGDRTFLLAAATVNLYKNPADPGLGSETWQGGEGFVGRRLYRHMRYRDNSFGIYNGDDLKIGFDADGNGYFTGTVFASGGEITGDLTVNGGSIIVSDGNMVINNLGISMDAAAGKFTSASVNWNLDETAVFSVGTDVDLGVPLAGYIEAVGLPIVLTGDRITLDPGAEYVSIAGPMLVSDDQIIITTAQTPASAGATGTAGTICWDTNYIYVCVSTDTWKRAALTW